MPRCPVLLLRQLLLGGLVGQAGAVPDLIVWMWIAGTHHGAAILKDLDIVDELARAPVPATVPAKKKAEVRGHALLLKRKAVFTASGHRGKEL